MKTRNAAATFFLGLTLFAAPAFADETAPPAQTQKSADKDFAQFEDEFGKDPAAKPTRDPLGGYNRFMFKVNDKFYFWVGKPLTRVYSFILPQPARVAVANGFKNLGFPIRFVSSVLQGKFQGAGREVGRFGINSTIGIGGLFDPAEKWMDIKPSDEDLGQVLGFYKFPYGFPLVLPFLGQSSLRDGIGIVPNFLLNPVYYVADYPTYVGVSVGDKFNYLSLHGSEYEKIKQEALDPYTFIRDAHRQNREKKIQE